MQNGDVLEAMNLNIYSARDIYKCDVFGATFRVSEEASRTNRIKHIRVVSILRLESQCRIATPPLRCGINPSYRRPFTARTYLSVQTSNSRAQLYIM
jgi:hypothetical protein